MTNDTSESRIRPLLGRREFITVFGSLVSGGALALEGCGGGGGASGGKSATGITPVPLTLSAVKGQITLPTGSSIKITQVMNHFGKNVPAADNSFYFGAAAETPLLAVAYGPNRGAVLYGFLSQANPQLSAKSTAVVLGYVALGVGAHLAEVQTLYLTAIGNATSLPTLESAVAAAIVARGEGWLSESDTALATALSALQTELSSQNATLQSVVLGNSKKVTRGVLLDKADRVSGLQVNADGAGSMTLTNYYRRRSYLYVDQISYKVKGTGVSVDSKRPVLPQPIKISAVKGVSNTLANLGALLGGQRDFYEPVVSDKIKIPVNPSDAASTTYTATDVGIGVSPGDFGKLTKVQQDGWWEVTVDAMVYDLVAPVIAGVVLPNLNKDINNFVSFTGAGGVLKDIINAVAASPSLRAKAEAGKLSEAAFDVLLLIVKSDTLKNVFLKAVFDFIALPAFYSPNNAWNFTVNGAGTITPSDRTQFLSESGIKLTSYLSKLNIGLQVFDTLTSALQLANCNNADVFTLEVTNAIVKLNPSKATADGSLTPIVFTADVTNADLAAGTLLNYQWSCTCKFGDISDGVKTNSTDGLSFPSNSKVLSYVPNGKSTTGDVDTVTVQVFSGPFNKRQALGEATSTVTVLDTGLKLNLVPHKVSLLNQDTATLTATLTGSSTVPSGQDITYRWETTGKFGGFVGHSANSYVAPSNTAVYKANTSTEGQDIITVTALLSTGDGQTLPVAQATATILTGPRKKVFSGRFFVDTDNSQPGRVNVQADIGFPKVAGATSYQVHCYNFNDPAYYGTEANFGWSGANVPNYVVDTGSEFVIGLAGSNSGDADSGYAASQVAYYTNRFQGIIVEVTVTY